MFKENTAAKSGICDYVLHNICYDVLCIGYIHIKSASEKHAHTTCFE